MFDFINGLILFGRFNGLYTVSFFLKRKKGCRFSEGVLRTIPNAKLCYL
jgi:hypothetical protein